MSVDGLPVLEAACAAVDITSAGAVPIRLGENLIYRLPGGVVARIARSGQQKAADREVRISQWLARNNVPAVRAISVSQPVDVNGRAVTFWEELPGHRNGTPIEVATALRRLHELPIPGELQLPPLAPFVRLEERIHGASTLAQDDRAWLMDHLALLKLRYHNLPPTRPHCVVHGDAWAGNVVRTDGGEVVFLDLERCSVGPPEWDLTSTAIKVTSLASIPADDFEQFCDWYGADVRRWAGFDLLRDIRELRMCSYVAQLAVSEPAARLEAEHRLRCLRGDKGPRPWVWTPF